MAMSREYVLNLIALLDKDEPLTDGQKALLKVNDLNQLTLYTQGALDPVRAIIVQIRHLAGSALVAQRVCPEVDVAAKVRARFERELVRAAVEGDEKLRAAAAGAYGESLAQHLKGGAN